MPFLSPFSRVTCPTCGHHFHLSAARWRDYAAAKQDCQDMQKSLALPNTPSVAPDRAPSRLKAAWGRFHVARNTRRWKKVCPQCRVDLPQLLAAGAASGERFAIVGGRTTGKSQLIFAWLDQLQKLSPRLGVSVRFVDTYDLRSYAPASSSDLWRERYANYLDPPPAADGKRPPPQVVPKNSDRRLAAPLIVRLVFDRRPLWHALLRPFADFQPVDLLFYDTAGENFDTRAEIQQFAGYVLSATGLVFLVDPLACPELSALLTKAPTCLGSQGAPSDLVGRLRDVYDDEQVVAPDQKIAVPTAIALTKSDLLREQFVRDNPHTPVVHHPDYRQGFPAADVEASSADLREYLHRAGQGGLLTLVETNFRHYRFFACSALGREPDANRTLDGPVEPFRVLDPIFWLLHQKGYLNAAPLPPALTEEVK